jgi:hypothetical protein
VECLVLIQLAAIHDLQISFDQASSMAKQKADLRGM